MKRSQSIHPRNIKPWKLHHHPTAPSLLEMQVGAACSITKHTADLDGVFFCLGFKTPWKKINVLWPSVLQEKVKIVLTCYLSAFFEYKEDGGRFPNPPSYSVATTLPSYDEAERSKEEAAVPLVAGRVMVGLNFIHYDRTQQFPLQNRIDSDAVYLWLCCWCCRRTSLWPGMTLKTPTSWE